MLKSPQRSHGVLVGGNVLQLSKEIHPMLRRGGSVDVGNEHVLVSRGGGEMNRESVISCERIDTNEERVRPG